MTKDVWFVKSLNLLKEGYKNLVPAEIENKNYWLDTGNTVQVWSLYHHCWVEFKQIFYQNDFQWTNACMNSISLKEMLWILNSNSSILGNDPCKHGYI